ncbi:hypothetical protein BDZ90DRAFT_39200 [Jaminaea rosea]|uniref:Uncharacterized protein n=1 Tax=Jaminaea rosea TaxID=1569628 RepID=A0A316URF3_9BASI|nr:hypothetical protein BDZ90DRAFT_39200 [Jaminaea rosea]PWN26453.1 hypothetical protein BDZ90DRAFT_39200 [Jaminaea rosea]
MIAMCSSLRFAATPEAMTVLKRMKKDTLAVTDMFEGEMVARKRARQRSILLLYRADTMRKESSSMVRPAISGHSTVAKPPRCGHLRTAAVHRGLLKAPKVTGSDHRQAVLLGRYHHLQANPRTLGTVPMVPPIWQRPQGRAVAHGCSRVCGCGPQAKGFATITEPQSTDQRQIYVSLDHYRRFH